MDFPEYKHSFLTLDGFGNGRPIQTAHLKPTYDLPAYRHIVQYADSFVKYLEKGGKAKDYHGHRYSSQFHLDVDAPGHLTEGKDSVAEFLKYCENKYGLNPQCVAIFYSGKKGFDLSFPSKLFGFFPHRQFEYKCKLLTGKFVTGHGISKFVDLPLYCRFRWLRLPNSLHQDTQRYKIPLSWQELKTLSMNDIEDLARKPRFIENAISYSGLSPIHPLSRLWQDCVTQPVASPPENLDDLLTHGVAKGERHDRAFLNIRVLRDQGYGAVDIHKQVVRWNKLNTPPIIEAGWPNSQIQSTLDYQATIIKSDTSQLTAIIRDHPAFKELSDAHFRCAITLLARTNTSAKKWNGIAIQPGQVICSHQSLAKDAVPRSVKNPVKAARGAIQKLIEYELLSKTLQLQDNHGTLYTWEGEFAELFQNVSSHPTTALHQGTLTTPIINSKSISYEDDSSSLVTPIEQYMMSSTKKVPPFLAPNPILRQIVRFFNLWHRFA